MLGDLNAVALEDLCGRLAAVTEVHGVTCDVSRVADIENLMAEAVEATGRIDVLVNTAGLWVEGPTEETTEADWDRVVGVNLKGTFFACSRAIPELKKTEGCIINLSSDAGLVGHAGDGCLHGVQGWRERDDQGARHRAGAAPRARQRGVPGDIMTPMLQYQADTYGGGDPEGYFKRLLASYFQGDKARFITPEEVAELIFFLGLHAGDADHRRQHLHRLRHIRGVRLPGMTVRVASVPTGPAPRRGLPARLAAPLAVVLAAVILLALAGPAAALYRPGDDWRHVESTLKALNRRPPGVPVVYLLGGSAARECITTEQAWGAQNSGGSEAGA